jgi:hypothetical protein
VKITKEQKKIKNIPFFLCYIGVKQKKPPDMDGFLNFFFLVFIQR